MFRNNYVGCFKVFLQGDWGGPLFCDGYQAGIISKTYRCGQKGFPDFFTNVSHYVDWIKSIAGKNEK